MRNMSSCLDTNLTVGGARSFQVIGIAPICDWRNRLERHSFGSDELVVTCIELLMAPPLSCQGRGFRLGSRTRKRATGLSQPHPLWLVSSWRVLTGCHGNSHPHQSHCPRCKSRRETPPADEVVRAASPHRNGFHCPNNDGCGLCINAELCHRCVEFQRNLPEIMAQYLTEDSLAECARRRVHGAKHGNLSSMAHQRLR